MERFTVRFRIDPMIFLCLCIIRVKKEPFTLLTGHPIVALLFLHQRASSISMVSGFRYSQKKITIDYPPTTDWICLLKWLLNKDPEARYKHNLTFSINNVLAHKNVFAVRFNRIPGINVPIVVKANVLNEERLQSSQVFLVRFFPSLTYRFKL